MKILKKLVSLTLMAAMLVSYIPAKAAYLEDFIIFDNLESYEVDYVPNGIKGWGSNSDKPVTVQEIDGNKAIRYRGVGGNGQFMYGNYTGKLWAVTDLLFPDEFTGNCYMRLSYNNQYNHALANMLIYGDGRLVMTNLYEEDGTKKNVTVCDDLPIHSGWINIRGFIDTDNQTVKIFVNDEQKGDEYDFCYKKWSEVTGRDPAQVADSTFTRIQFANVTGEGMDIYLDNFGISYSRDLNTETGYINRNTIIDIYDEYKLPETMLLPLEGDVNRELTISRWEAQGEEINFDNKQPGTYVYHGFIENTSRYVNYTIEIKNRYIKQIEDVYETTYQFSDYTLPEKVTVIMDDGNKKEVAVTWDENDVDTSSTGVVHINGIVESNHEEDKTTAVIIHVGIGAYAVKKIEDVYIGIPAGTAGFELPDRVEATVEDGTKKEVAVVWDGEAPDTQTPGIYNYNGTVAGYFEKIKMQVTVYEENIDDENILDILKEYYENCLTDGRDRTRYGYSESEPHPLFASGINRLTGEHTMWQYKDREVPLTDLASQTVLMKGLLGMSAVSDDDKYSQAVKDVYTYYLENYCDEDNHMMQWGGHMAINMADYTVDESMGFHELKDHYPLFDIMYEIDPEKTERYIKGIWKTHIKYPETLEFSRHYNMSGSLETEKIDNIWETIQNTFDKDTEPFFIGHSAVIPFITSANDFIYAAGELYGLNDDKNALQCALDLQNMYLKGRHDGSLDGKEATGLIPFIFTSLGKDREPILDVWAPEYTSSGFGNRMAFNLYDLDQSNPYLSDFGMEYDASIDITIYCYNPMVMFRIAEKCDDKTKKYLIDEAVETLASFIKVKYDPKKNQGRPMLIDGTDLSGYVRKRTGYTGSYGATFEPWELEADYILAFMRGYLNAMQYEDEKLHENSQIIWEAIRNVFEYYGVGEIGEAPGVNMELNYDTDCEEPFVLISLCEAYNKFKVKEYLDIARIVANNIAKERFSDGYFYAVDDMLHANFNTEEPYALVYFLATTKGIAENIPEHFGSRGYFQFYWWDEKTEQDKKLFSTKLWSLRTSSEILATAIELDAAEVTMKVGEKHTLSASLEPENTEDQTVEWESSNKDVCIINEDGIVTAVAPGEAKITATAVSGGCETTAVIKVE